MIFKHLVFTACGAALCAGAGWQEPYAAGGGFWKKRVPIDISRTGTNAVAGAPYSLKVGTGAGELPLNGTAMKAIRVLNQNGTEYFFNIVDAQGSEVRDGSLATGMQVVIPLEIASNAPSARYYIYADNPAAWLLPDYLPANSGETISLNTNPTARINVGAAESLDLKMVGTTTAWGDKEKPYRVPLEIRNFGAQLDGVIAALGLTRLNVLLQGKIAESSFRVTAPDGKTVPHTLMNGQIMFQPTVPPATVARYYLYFSASENTPGTVIKYEELLASKVNLARNSSFEEGGTIAEGWEASAPIKTANGTMEYDRKAPVLFECPTEGCFGRRCAKMTVPDTAPLQWYGWRQTVHVKPSTPYVYSGWIKALNISQGSVQLHGHFKNSAGQTLSTFATPSVGIVGTMEQNRTITEAQWEQLAVTVLTPADCSAIEMHLSMNARGTLWHDGILLAESTAVVPGLIEGAPLTDELLTWQVNPVVKVFRDSLPAGNTNDFRIAAARNEREGLHLAIRGRNDIKSLLLRVDPPVHRNGAKLDRFAVDYVGFVPVDFPIGYQGWHNVPPFRRRIPTASGSDGWAGLWPDPMLPHRKPITLSAGETQPFVVTFTVPHNTTAGDYSGKIIIETDNRVVKTIPLTVTVHDFTLPEVSHVGVILDVREGPGKRFGYDADKFNRAAYRTLAEHRAATHQIKPEPKFTWSSGVAAMDVAAHDVIARYCMDELKMPVMYFPDFFYAFGWGFPPRKIFNLEPFSKEYVSAYQQCLRLYWNYLKERGWQDRFSLYISDEPHFEGAGWHEKSVRNMVIEQMRKLCEMIHAVDPAIKIYSSTWTHCPEWDGYLNHWGVGFYGNFSVEKMATRKRAGDHIWFTADGTLCLDTPYSAIERLYPYFCYKYGVSAWEFWGSTWWTCDPFRYGWHPPLPHTFMAGQTPSDQRYPNGDGYYLYPGWLVGEDEMLSSIRLEQVRDGVEDFEYLWLLEERLKTARENGYATTRATAALDAARALVNIPNRGPRHSTQLVKDPDVIMNVREMVAREIVALGAR